MCQRSNIEHLYTETCLCVLRSGFRLHVSFFHYVFIRSILNGKHTCVFGTVPFSNDNKSHVFCLCFSSLSPSPNGSDSFFGTEWQGQWPKANAVSYICSLGNPDTVWTSCWQAIGLRINQTFCVFDIQAKHVFPIYTRTCANVVGHFFVGVPLIWAEIHLFW